MRDSQPKRDGTFSPHEIIQEADKSLEVTNIRASQTFESDNDDYIRGSPRKGMMYD